MDTSTGSLSKFVCPACQQSVTVDDPMRATLVERGCVVCGGSVEPTAFERLPEA
jgi:hypothetical protein